MDDQEKTIQDLLTVVEITYHQVWGEEPTLVESKFERRLKTSEQPYTRRVRVSEEWRPLELGWLSDMPLSLLIVQSREGVALRAHLSEEEQADLAARIIEVAYEGSPGWCIPPGESMRGCPSTPENLLLRCRHGEASAIIYAFPE